MHRFDPWPTCNQAFARPCLCSDLPALERTRGIRRALSHRTVVGGHFGLPREGESGRVEGGGNVAPAVGDPPARARAAPPATGIAGPVPSWPMSDPEDRDWGMRTRAIHA